MAQVEEKKKKARLGGIGWGQPICHLKPKMVNMANPCPQLQP